MKILYGVLSQGQGHANRAAVVIGALRERGHQLDVLTSGQPLPPYGAAMLGATRPHLVAPIFELGDGRLHVRASLRQLRRAVPLLLRHVDLLAKELARSRVDLVISDFEPVTAWAARRAGIPVTGVAGQYRMTHTDAPHPGSMFDRALARTVITACTPRLDRWLVVSFSPLRATHPRAKVIGPLVGEELRRASPAQGDHVLVYTYARPRAQVLAALPPPHRYRVYGLGGPTRCGHVELCATDRAAFVRDLVSCRAVVGNGSFQLASEAAVLGKPILVIPFAGQYEERFSAHQVVRAGLGVTARQLDRAAIEALLAHPPPPRSTRDGLGELLAEMSL